VDAQISRLFSLLSTELLSRQHLLEVALRHVHGNSLGVKVVGRGAAHLWTGAVVLGQDFVPN
jgi:hypothetical protein